MVRYESAFPAYGRDYKSQKEVREGWAEGHDFWIESMFTRGYVNIKDKPADMVLQIRYKNKTQVCVVK